jgi:predicted metal-binding membrane protein
MTHGAYHALPQLVVATLQWTAMMAVMMAPTVAPWVRAFHRLAAGRRGRAATTTLFALAYFVVWAGFAGAAASLQIALPAAPRVTAVLLILAGFFQLTPFRQSCLTHCRSPLTFLLRRWRGGSLPAFNLGLRHGAYCVGCCWAIMLTAAAAGLMNVWWMAALSVVTFAEQVMPWGRRLSLPTALALLAGGAAQW